MITQKIKIGDISHEVTKGTTPTTLGFDYKDSGIPFIRAKNLGEKYVNFKEDVLYIDQEANKALSRSVLLPGDLLISIAGTIGEISIVPDDAPLLNCNQAVCLIRLKDTVDRNYLRNWFSSSDAKKQIQNSKVTGVISNLSLGQIKNLELALPTFEEQRRIAAILDKSEALRTKRCDAIAKLDQLLQSVFLEMFGDPVRNEKNWQRVALGELLTSIDSGKSPVCLDRKSKENEWGVLKLGAVTKCSYIASENKALPENEIPDSRHEVKKGDLLFSRKNTRELVAACAIVRETPGKLLLPDLIFRLVIKEENRISPIYLHSLLIYPTKRKEVQSLAGGAAGSMPNISKAKLSELLVELPNIELQKKYESIANSIDKLRKKNINSLMEIEKLIQSIQSKFFSF